MQYILIVFISTLFLGCSTNTSPAPLYHTVNCNEGIYSLKGAECISDEEFIEKIEPYQVVFIGDHHSSKKHHKYTANIIHRLAKKGYRIHLANEWFTPNDNPVLKEYAKGELTDKEFVKKIDWKKRKYIQFDLFAPLYRSIIDTNGELYGVNLSKKERQLISTKNIAWMNSEEKSFFNSLDLDVSAHRSFLSPFFSYCHKTKNGESNQECIDRMYRVQVAWDTKMAKESAKLAKRVLKTDKDKLIVFAGAFHLSNSIGITLRFARESNIPYTTLLPKRKTSNYLLHGEADFLYLYRQEKEAKAFEAKLIKGMN